ncbi:MAG: sugar ABC transporter permease [Actinomyces sp.]|jgi:multiple sugar transport system permease protein|nr:sugar ABC transporter permease [Actinomyces sp.]MCI1641657.1 sugar ABC transporter permease [Actinomyces sp.]MCI1661870.1 sugar ABC transporter permease [Actinomyces sp.]MCI1690712.1 sugar ABC transporter permease [Actinomyces sp.]MCI1787560.1 sugar ABC transporter permease [Actinomyces sp.]MCI1829170.1 sugar ABC transporter permease [Actinomyces sp.]
MNRRRRDWRGWMFVGPFVVVFVLVLIVPLIYSLVESMFQYQAFFGTDKFIGADNYVKLFHDELFWAGLGRVALILVVQVPIMLGIAMLVALAIDSGRLHGSDFFRISVYLPYLIPTVVAALMWGFLYGTNYGLVSQINDAFGWHLNPFSPDWILVSIGNVITWTYIGYNMLIFYSSLRTIDTSVYEAAVLDGANEWQIVKSIKIPHMSGSIAITVIFSIIGTFQLFNEPSIMQRMAPSVITNSFTPNLYAYNLSFSSGQQGYAAALAIVMGVITVVIAYTVQLRGMRVDD